PVQEDLTDLGPVAVDRGHQDVAGEVVAELDDQLGEVGLVGGDAVPGQGLVEPDLLGGHRLDLDDLGLAGGLDQAGDDAVGLGGVAGPVDVAARVRDGLLQLEEVAVEVAQRLDLDGLAGRAQLRPVGELGEDARALVADGVGGFAEVVAELRVLYGFLSVFREISGHSEERGAHPSASVLARISARCITRTPVFWRRSVPPMCMRQELSAAHSTSAPVPSTLRALSAPIAADTAAFLTANVPPKPQHSSAAGSWTSSSPRTRLSSRTGRSPRWSPRSEWQVGW